MRAEVVTTLKRKATEIIAELKLKKEAVLITEQGRPAAYLVDVDGYERMQKRMAVLEAIAKGERDLSLNQTVSHDAFKASMAQWLK